MSENWQIALFTILGGAILSTIGGVLTMAYLLFEKQNADHAKLNEQINTLSNRLTASETRFEDWLDRGGRMAAKALHSPDDHLKVDVYMDKYLATNGNMAMEDWLRLWTVCSHTEHKPTASKLEQVYAEFLRHLCEHKLQGMGIPNREVEAQAVMLENL